MTHHAKSIQTLAAGRVLTALLAAAVLWPTQALAQVPARFYWKNLSGGNGVPVIFNSISGNRTRFDPANMVVPDAEFDATMALVGYAHTFELFDRAAMGAILLPMGRLSATGTVAGRTANQSASGFGDPTLEFTINLLGPKAQKNLPTRCATSRASRSTCSSTWRCRSASTTATRR